MKIFKAEDIDDLKVLAQLDILKICRKIGALNQLSEEQWTSLNKGRVLLKVPVLTVKLFYFWDLSVRNR